MREQSRTQRACADAQAASANFVRQSLNSTGAIDCEEMRTGCGGQLTDNGDSPGGYSYFDIDTSPDTNVSNTLKL